MFCRYMDKNLSIKLNGNRQVTGVLRGFDQFARLVIEHLEILESAEIERVVEGDRVVIVGRGRWRVRRTGHELRARALTIYGIERGRIVSYHVYTDTASFVAAFDAAPGKTLPGAEPGSADTASVGNGE